MKIFFLCLWMVFGFTTMGMTIYYFAMPDFQKATFYLVATLYADCNFYRVYNEIVEESKNTPKT